MNPVKQRLIYYYNLFAKEYHKTNYKESARYSPLQFRQRYIESMIEAANIPRGAKILDIGCGPGELVLSLSNKRYDVWGVDISESMVKIARDLLSTSNSAVVDRISVGDIEEMRFENCFFDVVIAAGVIEYQKEDEKSLRELNRVLKKGGYLILNVTNRYSYITLFDNAYRFLKKQIIIRKPMDFIKDRILNKGHLFDSPDRRTHLPYAFDQKLAKHGFKKVEYNYFHFSPVPAPFSSLFNEVCVYFGRRMETLTRTFLAPILAGGYIVMARKT